MQGRLDSALTDVGRAQANDHGQRLADQGIDLMLVSPLGRTFETANLLNSHVQAPLVEDERLVERSCGDWSGFTQGEIEKRFPASWQEREKDPYHHRPPGGENHLDMRERVEGLLESLFMRGEKRICLVTHGVMSRVILTYYLGLSPAQAIAIKHPNSLYYRLQFLAESILVHRYEQGEAEKQGLLNRAPANLTGDKVIGKDHFSLRSQSESDSKSGSD